MNRRFKSAISEIIGKYTEITYFATSLLSFRRLPLANSAFASPLYTLNHLKLPKKFNSVILHLQFHCGVFKITWPSFIPIWGNISNNDNYFVYDELSLCR